jgi:hypothetical protein
VEYQSPIERTFFLETEWIVEQTAKASAAREKNERSAWIGEDRSSSDR